MEEPPLAQDTPMMATPVLAVQALTKAETMLPVFMPGSLTPVGSFSFTPNGSASGCSCAGSVTARYSYPMPGVTAGARAASPRPAMLLWPIKKIRSTNCVHSMRNRSSHHCIKEYSNRIFRCQETNPTFCLNVSDFPAGIRKNPNKVGFVQGLSRICPFSNQQKACIIKTTQGAQDKAPQ